MNNGKKRERIISECGWQQTLDNAGILYMTYNFDPDRWYDDEYSLLEQARKQGRISSAEFDRRVSALSNKYDEMVARLDGTYQLPESSQ